MRDFRVLWRIKRFWRNLGRSWAYAKLGWSNYDFDHGYLITLMRFKLERMYAFLTGPLNMATHDAKTLKSLKLAVRLAKKLEDGAYYHFTDAHREKWRGVKDFENVPPSAEEKRAGIALISRPVNTPEASQKRKEFISAAEADENIRKRDSRWFFSILDKYHQLWWD